MIQRETIVYVVMPKRVPTPSPPASKPTPSSAFETLFLWGIVILIAVIIGIGIGASNSTHVPSPANPPVGPRVLAPSGTPGSPIASK